jgi:hypothetical protein
MNLKNKSLKKDNRNMTSKSVSKVSKKTQSSSDLSDFVLELLSSVLEKNQISVVRDVLQTNQEKIKQVILSSLPVQKTTHLKKIKDPSAPKRVKTSYIFFCLKKREEIKENNPDMSAKDIIKELGRLWRSLSDNDKETYVQMSIDDKERYEEESNEYVPPSNMGLESNKKAKRSGPKRGLAAYIYFCKDYRDVLKKEQPELSTKEITAGLGKKWQEMSADDKAPFVKMSEKDKDRYEKEKNQYEKERSGKEKSENVVKSVKPKKSKKSN